MTKRDDKEVVHEGEGCKLPKGGDGVYRWEEDKQDLVCAEPDTDKIREGQACFPKSGEEGVYHFDKNTRAMVCTDVPPSRDRHINYRLVAIALLFIVFLGVLVPYILVVRVDTHDISMEGVTVDTDYQITPINKYLFAPDWQPTGPRAAGVVSVDYFEGFETGTGGWTVGTLKYKESVEGSYSLMVNPASTASTRKVLSIPEYSENQTADIIFYTYAQTAPPGNLTGGWFVFSVNVTTKVTPDWVVLTFVLHNDTNYVPAYANELVFTDNQSNFVSMLWSAYLVNNVRRLAANYDLNFENGNMTVEWVEFAWSGLTNGFRFYFDAVEIQRIPYNPEAGVWKWNSQLVTDYVITVNYTVTIDTDVITDNTSVSIRIQYFETVNTTGNRRLIEVMLFDSLNFTQIDASTAQYNGTKSGTYHPFPDGSWIYGIYLNYHFDAYIEGWASVYDGRSVYDDATKDLSDLDFAVQWIWPLRVE